MILEYIKNELGIHRLNKKLNSKISVIVVIILWVSFAILLAAKRSFWWDEMLRLRQSYMSIPDALLSLWGEPSPFAPGEIFLNWLFQKIFSSTLPAEIWSRLPGITFEAATIVVSFFIAKSDKRARFLPVFVIFSVSLAMLSVQMRPYGSLAFCGAMAVAILLPDLKVPSLLVLISVSLGHIFGICYISLALILRRRYKLAAVGICIVVFTLLITKISPIQSLYSPPNLFEILPMVLFGLTNPVWASYFHAVLFTVGIILSISIRQYLGVNIMLVLVAATLGPASVIIASGYYFSLRHFIGAIVPFLYFSSLGLDWIAGKIKNNKIVILVLILVILGSSIQPWMHVFIFGKQRPLVDQPIHKFREIKKEIVENNHKKILLLNPCYAEVVLYYLGDINYDSQKTMTFFRLDSFEMQKYHFLDFQIETPKTALFCKANAGAKNNPLIQADVEKLLSLGCDRYDAVIYDQFEINNSCKNQKSYRGW